MILVDRRVGSKDLLPQLLAVGLPAEIPTFDMCADIAFIGKGPHRDVGIELKRLDNETTDLTQSLQSGRLSGEQLPKMLGPAGAYNHAWLLVEGHWQHDNAGKITVYYGKRKGWAPIRGGITADALEKRILSLELGWGLHVRFTNTRRDTVRFLTSLYRWFTDKDANGHTSHLAVHNPPSILAVSDVRQALMKLPGLGMKSSLAAERKFGSLRNAVNATVTDWAGIETIDDRGKTRRLGTAVALRIVEFCMGEKHYGR